MLHIKTERRYSKQLLESGALEAMIIVKYSTGTNYLLQMSNIYYIQNLPD
jgi:hypothetical protein